MEPQQKITEIIENQKKEQEEEYPKEIEVEPEKLDELISEIEEFEVRTKEKDEVLRERANKTFTAIIEDYQIGKLKDLKKNLSKYEEDRADKFYMKLKVTIQDAKERYGIDNWTYYEYFNIDRLIREKRLHPKSSLFKLLKKYAKDKNKIKIKEIKGLKVTIVTNEKGYGKILLI